MNSVAKIKDFIIERDFESYAGPVTAALKKMAMIGLKLHQKKNLIILQGL